MRRLCWQLGHGGTLCHAAHNQGQVSKVYCTIPAFGKGNIIFYKKTAQLPFLWIRAKNFMSSNVSWNICIVSPLWYFCETHAHCCKGEGDGVCNVLTYCVFTFIAAVSIIINNDGGFRGEDCTLVLRFRVFVPGDCRGCILGRRRLKDPSDISMYKINLLPPIKKHWLFCCWR